MSYPDTPKGRLQTKVAEKMATLVGSYLEYPLLPSKRKFLRSEALLVKQLTTSWGRTLLSHWNGGQGWDHVEGGAAQTLWWTQADRCTVTLGLGPTSESVTGFEMMLGLGEPQKHMSQGHPAELLTYSQTGSRPGNAEWADGKPACGGAGAEPRAKEGKGHL